MGDPMTYVLTLAAGSALGLVLLFLLYKGFFDG